MTLLSKLSSALAALCFAAGALVSPAADMPTPAENRSPLQWAELLARSELARRGTTLNFQGAPKAKWDYTTGYFSYAVRTLAAELRDPSLEKAAAEIVESYITPEGGIRTYKREDFNLDNVTPGRSLLLSYEKEPSPRIQAAITTLVDQLAAQPRTADDGFWHKLRYPSQMWLDGLFMASPFYAHYGKVFGKPEAFDDVARQISLIDAHLYDAKTGLYYHAWDETRTQAWADKTTGRSPNFWGRAEGWYAMAIVDVLDDLPPTHPEVEHINDILRRVAEGIARWQDPASGVWWQVLDQGPRTGNYLEASASSMYVYALAKGVNRGYLSRDRFLPVIEKAWAGLEKQFLRIGPDGAASLVQCCEVAGLGYTTAAGRARDGTFEYYVSEPVISNDLKGVSPCILAALEMHRLRQPSARTAGLRGWALADAIVARIPKPTIPAKDFLITDFGAVSGGNAAEALAKAFAAAAANGGGRVVVPEGEWNTGPLVLTSHTELHVKKGATLHFSTNPADYLPAVLVRWEGVEGYNYKPLIYALDQTDIAITGEGTLDGGATLENWWAWKKSSQKPARDRLFKLGETGVPVEQRRFGEGDFLRPNFIVPYRCTNVLIEGVTLVRSPMWEINPVLCKGVTVRHVKIDTHGPNNDGCNPDSSSDVLIEHCVFDTGDDCIAIKSGRNEDGRRIGVPSENIVIRHCTMKDGHGGVVIGSEISGGARNIFAEDCDMNSQNLDRMLRLKSNAKRGGVLENIYVRNVTVGHVTEAILTVDFLYEEGAEGAFPPVARNLFLENIRSTDSPRVLWLAGFPEATIEGIHLRDCNFSGVFEADRVQSAGTIDFQRVSITPKSPAKP